jgi:hypothetical protein
MGWFFGGFWRQYHRLTRALRHLSGVPENQHPRIVFPARLKGFPRCDGDGE